MKITIKKIITAICLLCLWASFSVYSDQAYLTDYQEQELLSDLDIVCQDVWCESEFLFDFHSFECSFDIGECLLGFNHISWRGHEDSFEVECLIPANSAKVLFDKEDSFRISNYLYKEVNSCIKKSFSVALDYYEEIYGYLEN